MGRRVVVVAGLWFVRSGLAPFTDRLVGKFGLPVHGWRGPHHDSSPDGSVVPLSTTPGTPGRSGAADPAVYPGPDRNQRRHGAACADVRDAGR